MNPKSLNAVYKQIKNNPDTSSKDYIFKTFRKDIPALSDVEKEFICDEFTLKKNSELETYYNLNEASNEKEEFIKNMVIYLITLKFGEIKLDIKCQKSS